MCLLCYSLIVSALAYRRETGFSAEEKLDARGAILGNVLQCMETLIDAVDNLDIKEEVTDKEEESKQIVLAHSNMIKSQCLRHEL